MTLPVSGTITLAQVNTELGNASTTNISMNQASVRSLFAVPTGAIAMSNGYGKSATTYATWNPSDHGTNSTLSGSNLVITNTGLGSFARSTVSKSSGKWYWEVTLTSSTLYRRWTPGIAKAAASNNGTLGSGADSYSYYVEGGQKFGPSSVFNTPAYGAASCVAGDIVGVALDLTAGTLTFYKNNVSQGVAYSGLTGTFFAGMGCDNIGTETCVSTTNFGASAFVYTPPAGYSAGLF